ncbi:MAG: glycosyltransferase family 2 protein [Thermoproteota archaeon]
MDKPLVSVIIPTYNSEGTISACLKSIREQTYPNIEIIIADSYSKDETVKIAERFNVKVVQTGYRLLGARYIGFKKSSGDVVLLIDSDQILERTVIGRAVSALNSKYDMLCLEEFTFEPKRWIQKLFEADRRLVHKLAETHLDPMEGVLLARVFRREILDKAFNNVPKTLFPIVVAHDHAIIYYEAYKVSQRVGILSNACWHIEPSSLWSLIKKNYRYGKSTYDLVKSGHYRDLLRKKVRFRKGAQKMWKLGLQSHFLLLIKAIGYYAGYFSARLEYLAR